MAIKLKDEAEVPRGKVRSFLRNGNKVLGYCFGAAAVGYVLMQLAGDASGFAVQVASEELCGKFKTISPAFTTSLDTIYTDIDFKNEAIKKLSGAIQIPTEIYDEPPSPQDDEDYYKEFVKFHQYLERQFPKVYSNLKVETLNKFALVYTWKGADSDLKPLMLTAHMDVVPVNPKTIDEWKYPPFNGTYDNEEDMIYGRGSSDCKNLLIAELVAVETLLEDGFKPERTLIMAFGFDEESSGVHGASSIRDHLLEKYGKDGIYAIVDEGGAIEKINENLYIATPIIAEKGYLDTEVNVHGYGGHSSMPPDHNTIGIAAKMIGNFEDNPFEYSFSTNNPLFGKLACQAEHNKDYPLILRKAVLAAPYSSAARAIVTKYLSASEHGTRDLIRTTRSVDIIRGGVKANALPEEVSLIVNHRVHIDSSTSDAVKADIELIREIAKDYEYGLTVEGEEIIPATKQGFIEYKIKYFSDPVPASPTKDSAVWNIFAGTIQDVYDNHIFADQDDVELYVGPSIISGNTDTRMYLNLTKNIYRFRCGVYAPGETTTLHSVNEHSAASSYLSSIAFLYEYIVNVNEHKDE